MEFYDPSLDKWGPVSEMSVCRSDFGVGVLDNVLYAVGGFNGSEFVKSAEKYSPSDRLWSSIPDMHLRRDRPGD